MTNKIKDYTKLVVRLAAICLVAAALPLTAGAQQISVPISNDVISGVISTPDGVEFEFSILNGGTLRVEDNHSGRVLGFVMHIDESLPYGEVKVDAYNIVPGPPGEEIVTYVAGSSRELARKDKIPSVMPEGYGVQLLHVKKGLGKKMAVPSLPELANDPELFLMGTCCVTCSGSTVCGCSVSAPCGSCSGGGCGGFIEDPNNPF